MSRIHGVLWEETCTIMSLWLQSCTFTALESRHVALTLPAVKLDEEMHKSLKYNRPHPIYYKESTFHHPNKQQTTLVYSLVWIFLWLTHCRKCILLDSTMHWMHFHCTSHIGTALALMFQWQVSCQSSSTTNAPCHVYSFWDHVITLLPNKPFENGSVPFLEKHDGCGIKGSRSLFSQARSRLHVHYSNMACFHLSCLSRSCGEFWKFGISYSCSKRKHHHNQ